MAISTTSWFNNGIMGLPQVGADVDIFETTTSPTFAVGTHFTRSDGLTYVYSHFGTALTHSGLIVGCDLSESGTAPVYSGILSTGSATTIAGETIKPSTAGSHYVEIIGGGVVVDEFAGGYFQIVAGQGVNESNQYRIRGNTASGAKTSGAKLTYYLELYEPLQRSVVQDGTGTTEFRIVGCQYSNLESVTATANGAAGVITCSHAASTYGWVQKTGVAAVTAGGASTVDIGTDGVSAVGSAVAISAIPGVACGMWNKGPKSGPVISQRFIGICLDSARVSLTNNDAVVLNIL